MAFSSPWGNYHYKGLAFGGIYSQDLFDTELSKIVYEIPRVLNRVLVGYQESLWLTELTGMTIMRT